MVDKELLEFTEQELTTKIVELSDFSIQYIKAKQLAKETVMKLDWCNEALMHKGVSWIAKEVVDNHVK